MYSDVFLHVQLLLVTIVHRHDLFLETFSARLDIVFVFAPRKRHDHLQVVSVPFNSDRIPSDRSCELDASVVALPPKYTPSSHMQPGFPSGPPTHLVFHKIPSTNIMPCTFADGPSTARARFLHRARPRTSSKKNPASSAIHGQIECVAAIFSPTLALISLQMVLITP